MEKVESDGVIDLRNLYNEMVELGLREAVRKEVEEVGEGGGTTLGEEAFLNVIR